MASTPLSGSRLSFCRRLLRGEDDDGPASSLLWVSPLTILRLLALGTLSEEPWAPVVELGLEWSEGGVLMSASVVLS